jgi:5'(3')-deoxyribonucleotidase
MLFRQNLIVPIRLDARLPRILIDQDNVLAKLIPGIVNQFNQLNGTNHQSEECIDWDLTKTLGPKVNEIFTKSGLFRDLEPVRGALEVFERLFKSGRYDMYIVSAAEPLSYSEKVDWIKEHLPFFPLKNLIVCHTKDAIWGDILLDDGAHNIKAFEGIGEPVVFDMPHNRHLEGYERVYDWYQFEKYINEKFYGCEEYENL